MHTIIFTSTNQHKNNQNLLSNSLKVVNIYEILCKIRNVAKTKKSTYCIDTAGKTDNTSSKHHVPLWIHFVVVLLPRTLGDRYVVQRRTIFTHNFQIRLVMMFMTMSSCTASPHCTNRCTTLHHTRTTESHIIPICLNASAYLVHICLHLYTAVLGKNQYIYHLHCVSKKSPTLSIKERLTDFNNFGRNISKTTG